MKEIIIIWSLTFSVALKLPISNLLVASFINQYTISVLFIYETVKSVWPGQVCTDHVDILQTEKSLMMLGEFHGGKDVLMLIGDHM